MNLKGRLILANTATVVIPVIITVLVALASIFIYSKLFSTNLSLQTYQRLAELRVELSSSEQSILRQSPEAVEEDSFQKYLKQQLAAIKGQMVIIKDNQVLFASREFSKIDLAKIIDAGEVQGGLQPVILDETSYTIQPIDFNFKDGSPGKVLLLAPINGAEKNLTTFLVVLALVFACSFLATNAIVTYQFSRSIIKPLNNLQQAAAEIRSGNLDCQIIEEGDQELRELCRDLELMRIKLKESIYNQLKYEEHRKLLVSSISHDLKTPVTSIKGYVEGIIDGVANTQEKRERYLKTIHAKAQQVDTMLDDLLLYAKLDLKQIPFNFEQTNIVEYLSDCVLENEPELENEQIKLTLLNELPESRYVLLDRERMRRVIMNILDNSRKYLDKQPGEIQIMVRETTSSIIVELRDNGSGIKERDLPFVFERFFRSDQARSGIKGSGLGLAIAKQIVEGHDGRIWAISHGTIGTSIMISLSKLTLVGKRYE